LPILHVTAKRNQRDFTSLTALLRTFEEPTWEQIEAAVAGLSAPGPLYVVGGEPMLRRDIVDILQKIARRRPDDDLVLVSDGRAFSDPQACQGLAAAGTSRLVVEVVLASHRQAVHDALFGVAGSFEPASLGIGNLLARGQRTRVRVLIGLHNLEHLHEVAAHLPDRFVGLDRIVWDVAALMETGGASLGLRPDQVASYLESTLNLVRGRGLRSSVLGTPLCTLRADYHSEVEIPVIGSFRDACNPCLLRPACPGMIQRVFDDHSFPVRPHLPAEPPPAVYAPRVMAFGSKVAAAEPVTTSAAAQRSAPPAVGAQYEQYLLRLLAHYVPAGARAATTVLDAMCGQAFPNLGGLRRFFSDAVTVQGTDIDVDERGKTPPGTSLFRADLLQPMTTDHRYDFVAVFKPPGDKPEFPIARAMAHLATALLPEGHLLIVLAEHTDVAPMLAILETLSLATQVSEANALGTFDEPEHKWVIVCRAGPGAVAHGG